MPLNQDDKKNVVQRYKNRIEQHGVTFESLSSGSEEKQRIRHQVHASVLYGDKPSVLDVGCGLGQFRQYLSDNNHSVAYTGYDIVPEYVDACRERYPEDNFEGRNIFETGIEGQYDSIILCQVLNNRYEKSSNMEVMKFALEHCFEHSKVSVSIDMLSSYVDFEHPEVFYYDPRDIFDIARSITKRVIIRHDYRPFEFCIQLIHDDVEGYVR